MVRTALIGAMALAMVAVGARGATAQGCPGDCNGDGMVTVSELILSVNIALGAAALDACRAIDPGGTGTVGVAQLIAAVGGALCACQPCPPPPPTATRTRTPTHTPPASPTPSVTPTATPEPLVSRWIEDTYRLPRSTCPRQVNEAIRAELPGQSAIYVVTERGMTAEVDAGGGSVVAATVDAEGILRASNRDVEMQGSCTVVVDGTLAVSLRATRSTATYDYAVSSSGCPNNLFCTLTITARWRRTDNATAAAGGGAGAARLGPRLFTP